MTFRVWLILLVAAFSAATTAVAHSSEHILYLGRWLTEAGGNRLVANTVGMDEEMMMMGSEAGRRQLGGGGYISYGALARNNVPCGKKGNSYYDCRGAKANPYKRGCTKATRCARSSR